MLRHNYYVGTTKQLALIIQKRFSNKFLVKMAQASNHKPEMRYYY